MRRITLSLLILMTLVSSSFAAETVKVGDNEVSIDFGEQKVNISAVLPFAAGGLTVYQTKFISDDLRGTVSICEPIPFTEHSILVSNCDRLLEMLMKQDNFNVDVTPYEEGFFGTGEYMSTGKPTHALLTPVDVDFGRASRLLVVISSSSNEELSKSIISSAIIS